MAEKGSYIHSECSKTRFLILDHSKSCMIVSNCQSLSEKIMVL